MLRIMNPGAPAPPGPDQAEPVSPAPAEPQAELQKPERKSLKYDAEKTSQQISGYMSSDQGPFECQRCIHWEEPNACRIVSGSIEPTGCCNIFERDGDENPGEADDQNIEEPSEPAIPPQSQQTNEQEIK